MPWEAYAAAGKARSLQSLLGFMQPKEIAGVNTCCHAAGLGTCMMQLRLLVTRLYIHMHPVKELQASICKLQGHVIV